MPSAVYGGYYRTLLENAMLEVEPEVAGIAAILACLLGCIIVDQLRRDNNNVPIATVWRQLSHWSPSLESDATVRADYALTTPMIIVDRLL